MTEQMQCMEVWGGNQGVEQHFHLPGLDVWLYSRPYDNASNGGDVYYLSSCASGRISRLLLADVSGHGPVVSQFALRLRDLMRRNINRVSQVQFVEGMNEQFINFQQEGLFATTLVGTYFASTGSFQLCVAGHPRPLLYRSSTRTWDILGAEAEQTIKPNLPLGIVNGLEFGQMSLALQPGDMLLLYTDGLTEARLADGQLLSEPGLLKLVQGLDVTDPHQWIPSLLASLRGAMSAEVGDDMTLLLARADSSRVSLRDNLLAPFRLLRQPKDRISFRQPVGEQSAQ
ncbi:MAG: PP2C family protein-serine/threonine phosphatase [Gemmatales bacterium]